MEQDVMETIDGRSARRNRNRDAVLDAVLELFAEGHLSPSAPMVAERSGMSPRSVYRYFDDADELVRAAIARNLGKVQPIFDLPDLGEGPLAERIERQVDGRLALYEEIAPMMRATLRRADSNDIIREAVGRNLRAMHKQINEMFAPELSALAAADRDAISGSLDVLLGFHSIEHLRQTRGLGPAKCRSILVRSLAALLSAGD